MMLNVIFRDSLHFKKYCDLLDIMSCDDEYHKSVAYLISLDDVVYCHFNDVFDIYNDSICSSCLSKYWQTSTSLKTIRLIFNLWNGFCYDGKTYTDDDGYKLDLPSRCYNVDEIFNSSLSKFYYQAIKLRYYYNYSSDGPEGLKYDV